MFFRDGHHLAEPIGQKEDAHQDDEDGQHFFDNHPIISGHTPMGPDGQDESGHQSANGRKFDQGVINEMNEGIRLRQVMLLPVHYRP